MREVGYGGAGGKVVEEELFGGLTMDKRLPYEQRLNPLYRKMDLKDAMDYARKAQLGDPLNPYRRFAKRIRQILSELLEIKDQSQLKFYSSIDSPADWKGVDGFIDFYPFTDKPDLVITLTMDIATYDKGEPYKDIDVEILAQKGGYDLTDPEDKALLEELAQETAEKLFAAAIGKRDLFGVKLKEILDKN